MGLSLSKLAKLVQRVKLGLSISISISMHVSWNLLKNGSLLPKKKQCKRCCERKSNFTTEQIYQLCLEATDRFRMNIYTSNHHPSASLTPTPTQEKIALLKLEMCYLQVRSCQSQVRIIRISQQTSSLFVSVFVLVSIQIIFNGRTFLMSSLLKTNF